MVYDIIPIIIIISGLIVIAVIVIRKFPQLAAIDVSKIQSANEDKLRNHLLERRLKRKLGGAIIIVKSIIRPIWAVASKVFSNLYKKIEELEKNYRKPQSAPATVEEKIELDQRIRSLFLSAEESLKENDLEEAEKKYIEIINLDPKNLEAFKSLGNLYFAKKEYDQAKEAYKHVIKLNEKDDDAYSNIGLIESTLGDFESAEKDYLKSIDLSGQKANHYFDLGLVYQAEGKNEKALEYFQKSVDLEGANPKYLDYLLNIAIILKKKSLARECLDKLKETNPENEKLGEFEGKIKEIK